VTDRREPLPTRVDGLPALPASYGRTLTAGLAALEIHLEPGQRGAIDRHVQLLLAWNRAINLTAISDAEGIAREHVLDSLTALPLLRQRGVKRLLDLGSGSGFPGLALAVSLNLEHTLLVESIGKKARFLDAAAGVVGLGDRLSVVNSRVEALASHVEDREAWPLVTARAVASLRELVELAFPLLFVGGVLVAWKRAPIEPEVATAREAIKAVGGGAVRISPVAVDGLQDHVLVVVEKISRTPSRFPRDAAERRRHPL